MLGTQFLAIEILNILSSPRQLPLVPEAPQMNPSPVYGEDAELRHGVEGYGRIPALLATQSFLCFACLSPTPGMVPEPADERQEAAPGHDLAPPGGSSFLYLHDEPRGGHRQLALPLPLPPAPALLFPHGPRSRFGFGRSRPFQFPAEAAGQLSRPLPPVPATRTAVRLPTPLSLCRSDPRAERCRREPLLLLGLSRQSGNRVSPAAFGIGL